MGAKKPQRSEGFVEFLLGAQPPSPTVATLKLWDHLGSGKCSSRLHHYRLGYQL